MIGRTVGHYQFVEKLGSGGMGEVYKAQDTNLGRFVAIKVLPSARAGDPEHRRRFRQEAQAASALNHPNIITIYDMVTEGDSEFIVMEYLAGRSLNDLIPAGGLRVPQALKFALQISDALSAAHAAGIVHRDLKPANIRVTDSGLVKVLDFGLAKLTGAGVAATPDEDSPTLSAATALTVEGAIMGTVRYMSPEQAEGKKVDARSDIFSFGAVFYEMLTGRRAFEGDSGLSTLSAILRDDVKPMAEVAPDVPAQLESLVGQCLRKNPDDRWQRMREVHAALAGLVRESESGTLYGVKPAASATDLPGGSKADTTQLPAVAAKKSSGPMVGIAAAVLLAAAGGGFWMMKQQPAGRSAEEAQPQALAQAAKEAAAGTPTAGTPAAGTPTAGTQGAPAEETVNNDSVLELVKAKVPATLILDQIRSAKSTSFNLSSAELIRLSRGGVSEAIIEQMRDPHRAPRVVAPGAAAQGATAQGATAQGTTSQAATAQPAAAQTAAAQTVTKSGATPAAAPTVPATPTTTSAVGGGAAGSEMNRVAITPPIQGAPQQGAPQQGSTQQGSTQQGAAKPTKRQAAAAASSAAAAPVTISDAATFRMTLANDIPINAKQGTPVHFNASEDLRVGDTLVVAKGTAITGEISEVPKKGGGKLSFTVSRVTGVGGIELKVRMRRENDGGPNKRVLDAAKIGNASAAAVQGTKFAVFVDGPQTISIPK